MISSELHAQSINNSLSKHFIFNTLNNINSYIVANNASLATDYLSKFGKLLRMVIEHSGMHKVSLAKEIEALKLYLWLEKKRFSLIDLDVNIASNIAMSDVLVPPLILQPYIENAIWQSLVNNTFTKIVLDISLSGAANICYSITEQKNEGKPKLRQAPMPHEVQDLMKGTKDWLNKNNTLFNVEKVDLYNEQQIAIAQKTIIMLPLI
jgi:LytS/YehU family sensor histidine kinase